MRASRCSLATVLCFVPLVASGCGDPAPAELGGRYQARDPSGGYVGLEFRGEGKVWMGLGSEPGRFPFGRELTYTRSGEQVTVLANPEEGQSMTLAFDGDSLTLVAEGPGSGGKMVFERQ